MAECDNDFVKLSLTELDNALSLMKMGKASGLEGITFEMIKHFSPYTNSWILDLFNECAEKNKIPNGWKKARVVDLLKTQHQRKASDPSLYHASSTSCMSQWSWHAWSQQLKNNSPQIRPDSIQVVQPVANS